MKFSACTLWFMLAAALMLLGIFTLPLSFPVHITECMETGPCPSTIRVFEPSPALAAFLLAPVALLIGLHRLGQPAGADRV